MIKYTAHADILRKYDSIAKNSKKRWDDHYLFALTICGTAHAYFACGDFWKHYKEMTFFSPVSLKEIPVNGVMISVEYFTETKI